MKRRIFYLFAVSAALFAFLFGARLTPYELALTSTAVQEASPPDTDNLVAGSPEKFDYLSLQNSNACSLQPASLMSYPETTRLQGSCCSPMDLHRYQEQVEGLKAYAGLPQVPEDPYDIPTVLAKELLSYQREIVLTPDQQSVYDRATELSEEGGPCCCGCWRWHAFEGQAKYLITQHDFTAEQIGDLWSLEDGCGGTGHTHQA